MKIFLYEFFTGGGGWSSGEPPEGSLLAEARAMVMAVSADFVALEGVGVVTMRDSRLPQMHPAGCEVTVVGSAEEERAAIERLARGADWTLVIAPETGGALLERCRQVEELGGRLLSPPSTCVEICASKQSTAERLRRCGVPAPRGWLVGGDETLPPDVKLPIVIKPDDGCGSQGVRMVGEGGRETYPWSDFRNGETPHGKNSRPLIRAEEFVPGLAASVSVLCGPAGSYALPACQQDLSGDGRFAYCGGKLPLEARLDRRARKLGLAAVAALPEVRGYLGVDLVLGEADDGSGDYVIEINPRLTTSYVGLRALARTNLAAAMLAVVAGQSPDLSFAEEQVEFSADGAVVSGADVPTCRK